MFVSSGLCNVYNSYAQNKTLNANLDDLYLDFRINLSASRNVPETHHCSSCLCSCIFFYLSPCCSRYRYSRLFGYTNSPTLSIFSPSTSLRSCYLSSEVSVIRCSQLFILCRVSTFSRMTSTWPYLCKSKVVDPVVMYGNYYSFALDLVDNSSHVCNEYCWWAIRLRSCAFWDK